MGRTVRFVAASLLAGSLAFAAHGQTIFWLDTPADGAVVSGIVRVEGWVLDDRGVSNIDLYVDGQFVAAADINIPRYDVIQAYPWFMGTASARPGFRTGFDARTLTAGEHTLFLRVTFGDGTASDFGERTVTVDDTRNQVPFGELELPGEDEPIAGVYPLTGWALDDSAVSRVEVLVDGYTYAGAVTGIERPDVANRFPGIAGAETAGFLFNLNTSKLTNGVHVLAVRVWDDEGASRVVGQRHVFVNNNWANLVPFGVIEYPPADHVFYARGCGAPSGGGGSLPPGAGDPLSWEIVAGWALDPDDGVQWVELLLDGAVIGSTNPANCHYESWFGMDVNCYGAASQLREDIFRLYSDVPNSKHSQYTFMVDVSYLVTSLGVSKGAHVLSVRAGDHDGHQTEIASIPVVVQCDDYPDRPSWGDIYTPEPLAHVSGTYTVTGFALDYDHIVTDGVEIWVDGTLVGMADYPLSSPEVPAMFPYLSATFTATAGYSFDLDTTALTDGEHQLVVITQDAFGNRTAIGQRTFYVDNLGADSARPALAPRVGRRAGSPRFD